MPEQLKTSEPCSNATKSSNLDLSKKNLNTHKGQKFKASKRLLNVTKKKKLIASAEKGLNFPTEENLGSSSSTPIENGKKVYCEICNVTCPSIKNFKGHIKGRRHLSNISALTSVNSKKVKSSSDLNLHLRDGRKSSEKTSCVNSHKTEEKLLSTNSNMSQNYYDRRQSNYSNSHYYHPSFSHRPFLHNRRFFTEGPSWSSFQNSRSQAYPIHDVYPTYNRNESYNFYANQPAYDHYPANNNAFFIHNSSNHYQRSYSESEVEINEYKSNSLDSNKDSSIPLIGDTSEKTSNLCLEHKDVSTSKNHNYGNKTQNSPNLGKDVCLDASTTFKKISPSIKQVSEKKISTRTRFKENGKKKSEVSSAGSGKQPRVINSAEATDNKKESGKRKSEVSSAESGKQPRVINFAETTDNKKESGKRKSEVSSAESAKQSRVINSAETTGNKNTTRGENQSMEPDKSVDDQKIQNYTSNLLEISPGQISRLIHPSNHKDKAAVSHLMTKLSKSKKKENLSKLKIRSDSLCSSGTTDEDDNPENKTAECEYGITSSIVHASSLTDSFNDQEDLHQSLCAKLSSADDTKINIASCDSLSQNKVLENPFHKESFTENTCSKEDENKLNFNIKTPIKRKSSLFDSRSKKPHLSGESGVSTNKPDVPNMISDAFIKEILNEAANFQKVSRENMHDIKQKVSYSEENIPSEKSTVPTFVKEIDPQHLNHESGLSINSLVNLFASGSITAVKQENDPVIDALQNIDHDLLMKACSSQSIFESEFILKKFPATDETSTGTDIDPGKDNRNCISPVIFSSNPGSSNMPVTTTRLNNSDVVSNVISVLSGSQNSSSLTTSATDNILDLHCINFMPKNKPDYSEHLKKLVIQLRDISTEEEKVKLSLEESRCKVNEYQQLLEEWKKKKEKLQEQEESLRKNRIEVIELMQNAVKATDVSTESLMEINTSAETSYSKGNENEECDKNSSQAQTSTEQFADTDEIQIIPVKTKKPEVIVIDDDTDENLLSGSKTTCENQSCKSSTNVPKLFDTKHLEAHKTIINCLLVFENHLYTCSNDSTGRRFNMNNPSESVTYLHSAKNVTEIVVEKVQNEALVLTSCSNRMISLFIALNGTKIRSFCQNCGIMSICKGWGNFFSGLADGTINMYNWKYEEKELAKCEYAVCRIATTHQGRLHILVVLTSNGHISVRDAETGLLIRYIKGFVKLPSWLTVYSDVAYLSSCDKTLTVLDLMTGKAEKKLYVSNHTTGLAVYKDYIFTISFSGLVNCYNKERMSEKKLYYGAGKNGLTCIYVFEDWVLTGNRKGDISLFKFDPNSSVSCQFGQCCYTFGLKEDLNFHLERDHVVRRKKLTKCFWGICNYSFPPDWSMKEKLLHMKKHVTK